MVNPEQQPPVILLVYMALAYTAFLGFSITAFILGLIRNRKINKIYQHILNMERFGKEPPQPGARDEAGL